MSQEALKTPNPDVKKGEELNKHLKVRKKIFGQELSTTGFKGVAVGLFAVGAILATGIEVTMTAPLGLIAAAAVGGYGLVKWAEGAGRRLMAR